ncbi:putative acyltransferase [Podospora conica]|nr:putative acyltransferase [Schizothecium conicum]
MEKFSQFRDRGSGVSPFLPIKTPSTLFSATVRIFIFLVRLFFFLPYAACYFFFLQHLPLPAAARKLLLWGLMGIAGVWWLDLQLDNVKRGSLWQQPPSRVPHPRSVIAANFTSPVDALYLAGVFDPIFTLSYPGTRKVRRVGLLRAMWAALSPAQLTPGPPPSAAGLTDIRTLLAQNPTRTIAVFPECATTNGQGILPLSPSLLTVPSDVSIFPLSMRYTPADVTTPVPGYYKRFLWKLLSRPTHCVRVRIAEALFNTSQEQTNGHRWPEDGPRQQRYTGAADGVTAGHDTTAEEQRVLDKVAEALARLGRAKRVGLTVHDKKAFVEAWKKSRSRK